MNRRLSLSVLAAGIGTSMLITSAGASAMASTASQPQIVRPASAYAAQPAPDPVAFAKEIGGGLELHDTTLGELLAKVPDGAELLKAPEIDALKDKPLDELLAGLPTAKQQLLNDLIGRMNALAVSLESMDPATKAKAKTARYADTVPGEPKPKHKHHKHHKRKHKHHKHYLSYTATHLGKDAENFLTGAGSAAEKTAGSIITHAGNGLRSWANSLEKIFG